jgi:hypothetical protein
MTEDNKDNKDTLDSLALGERRRDRLDSIINYAGSGKRKARKADLHGEQTFDEIATLKEKD